MNKDKTAANELFYTSRCMDFSNIEYLQLGNEKQQRAYKILTNENILTNLSSYEPILVGTIPINIDINTSDLDIVCYWREKQEFVDKITSLFGELSHFKIRENKANNAIIANFVVPGFEIEIFGQNIPTKQQVAYRHLMIEYKLLKQRGEKFRQEIIDLKLQGHETEPAFGIALGLKGNAYEELLTL